MPERSPGKPYNASVREQALALYADRKSSRAVAETLGVNYRTVQRWVRESGPKGVWRCPCDPLQRQYETSCRVCGRRDPRS